MTRTGLSGRLSAHRREPLVEIQPDDAANLGIADTGLARLITAQGESIFRVQLSDGQRRGAAFVPIHWTDQQSTGGRTGRLPRPPADPFSRQPGFQSTPLPNAPLVPAWTAFLVSAFAPSSTAQIGQVSRWDQVVH